MLHGTTAGVGLSVPHARPGINLLRLTCVVAFTATWVAFILSSLVIVSVVAWSDGCQFLELAATRGWETVGLDGLSAGVRHRVCPVRPDSGWAVLGRSRKNEYIVWPYFVARQGVDSVGEEVLWTSGCHVRFRLLVFHSGNWPYPRW